MPADDGAAVVELLWFDLPLCLCPPRLLLPPPDFVCREQITIRQTENRNNWVNKEVTIQNHFQLRRCYQTELHAVDTSLEDSCLVHISWGMHCFRIFTEVTGQDSFDLIILFTCLVPIVYLALFVSVYLALFVSLITLRVILPLSLRKQAKHQHRERRKRGGMEGKSRM